MGLKEYKQKRQFETTPEPAGGPQRTAGNSFVVQKHDATRLHYDFRLEIGGVLVSWAVPKGPSLNPADKRLAMQTEDHPLEYGGFEGVIPEGNYGAGPVIVWDNGTWEPEGTAPPAEQMARGDFKFRLHGQKLRGSFVLVHTKRQPKGNDWLLIKHRDEFVDPNWDIDKLPRSVLSGRTIEEVEQGVPGRVPGPGGLPGARKSAMPTDIEPQLAALIDKPFSSPDWIFELKWDGMRVIAYVRDGKVELKSRRARAVTTQFPELTELPARLGVSEAILDGEVVVLDEAGRPDFGSMQQRMNVAQPPRALVNSVPVIYYIFDVMYADGYDLRAVPLIERKRYLRAILTPKAPALYCSHIPERGEELYRMAVEQGLEGIIGKQAQSKYSSVRNSCWVKLKTSKEVDAVVGGFTAPRGGREHFGALLVGLYRGEKLEFIGGVGTGFDRSMQEAIHSRLASIVTSKCPFAERPVTREKAQWVEPNLVARVKFSQWTHDGHLRAPVFLGLDPDADPKDSRFDAEQAAPAPSAEPSPEPGKGREELERQLCGASAANLAFELDGKPLRLTNLNKVYFPKVNLRKRDLLCYYLRVADLILPFLRDRPMVLRRRPEGMNGEMFYQKEAGEFAAEWMRTHTIFSEDVGREVRYFVCDDAASLLYLTNLGCIDHDPWSSRVDDLEHPDWVFIDLDPTDGTDFSTVVEVAKEAHAVLAAAQMKDYIKTSGASGIHIFVPVERVYTYEQVRKFAEVVARIVSARLPQITTLERAVGKRPKGRVYLDYNQIAWGKPLASVYSVRPEEDASVSAPVTPRELRKTLRPSHFTLANMTERIAKVGDLWADFFASRQRLEDAVGRLREGAGMAARG